MATDTRHRSLKVLKRLREPGKIQEYMNRLGYNTVDGCMSPLKVIQKGRANCMEGALLAAACLKESGRKPLIMDLRAVNDDDHVITLYRGGGLWGAMSKSNFTTLEFREPAYRSLREIAMSYFDLYFNLAGQKTLREYSIPLDLTKYDSRNWVSTDEDLSYIGSDLDETKHYRIISKRQIRHLHRTADKLVKASIIGADKKGIYKPKK